MAIVHCVKRNLILTCPNWAQSTECGSLMAFAKKCSKYPTCDSKNKEKPKKEKGK
jgi:hypothetical protein